MARRFAAIAIIALAPPPARQQTGTRRATSCFSRTLSSPSPCRLPAAGAQKGLTQAVAAGFRVKVAVIGSQSDLGAIPSLFGKPADYAKFLGTELSLVYVGPLLIVMPAGYGIYDGSRSTAAERAVLSRLTVGGAGVDA
jgi:hypothetical protein